MDAAVKFAAHAVPRPRAAAPQGAARQRLGVRRVAARKVGIDYHVEVRAAAATPPWPRTCGIVGICTQPRKRLSKVSRWRSAVFLDDSSPSAMVALACVAIVSRRPGVQKSSRIASPISAASARSTSKPVE